MWTWRSLDSVSAAGLVKRIGKLGRKFGLKMQCFTADRVTEDELPGMKKLPIKAVAVGASVDSVADKGVPDGLHVDPDLVGATGLELHLEQTVAPEGLLDFEMRAGFSR